MWPLWLIESRGKEMQYGKRAVVGWLCALLLCCVWVGLADATTVAWLTEAQLVERSSLIVRGQVASVKSQWNRERTAIITLVKVNVFQELLQRKAPTQVTVGLFGGVVGQQRMLLPGSPRFEVNEKVLLFLHQNPVIKGEYMLTGWMQGKWNVDEPKASFAPGTPTEQKVTVSRPMAAGIKFLNKGRVEIKVDQSATQKITLATMSTRVKQRWFAYQKRKRAIQGGANVIQAKATKKTPNAQPTVRQR